MLYTTSVLESDPIDSISKSISTTSVLNIYNIMLNGYGTELGDGENQF